MRPMRDFVRRAVAMGAVVALVLAPLSCKKGPAPGAGPEDDVDPSAPEPDRSSAPAKPKVSYFDAVVEHLDVGGPVFAYRDLHGKVDAAVGALKELMTAAGSELPPESRRMVQALDLKGFVKDLGLSRIVAAGASSKKVGDRYLNKLYVHTPEGRSGVLSLLGRDAAAFESRKIAPAGCDFLIERELNLAAGYGIVRDLVARLKEPEATKSWNQLMGQKVADAGMTVADVFQQLDTRAIILGRLSDTETLEIPDSGMKIPKFDLYVSLEGMGFLFDQMVKQLPPDAAAAIEKGDGYQQLAVPMPPNLQAVVRKEIKGSRIVVASSAEFLAECQAGGGGLFNSTEFGEAFRGLPDKGNGLVYVSKDVGRHIESIIRQTAVTQSADEPMVEKALGLAAQILPVLRSHYAQVSANLAEGVLTVSNSPTSWKGAVAGVPAALALVGFLAYKS